MTVKQRISAAVSTHVPNMDKVKAEDSEFSVNNSQKPAEMLYDVEDIESGSTHSDKEPKLKVKKVAAALHDKELPDDGSTHMPNDEDPANAYLEQESGMPVIDPGAPVASVEDEESMDDEFEDETQASLDDEFSDLDNEIESDVDEEMDEFEAEPEVEAEMETDDEMQEPEEEVAEFEAEAAAHDDVSVLDIDQVPEQDESELQFATIANCVHVIRSNRIIASMGPRTAAKIGASDVYLTPQFQDVVMSGIEQKGIRKGLVQSGFVLSKVRVSASKTTAKVVEAKVTASLKKQMEASATKEKAMEQCLAIAAVGINRQFFKDAKNELKTALESELVHAGVRGGSRIVRAMFAQHGVSYARAILTLASKLSAMPEVVRNQYAEALDMTSDGDFEPEDQEVESVADEDMAEFEPFPSSVSAALHNPIRKDVGVLLAGVKTTAALDILNGNKSLI